MVEKVPGGNLAPTLLPLRYTGVNASSHLDEAMKHMIDGLIHGNFRGWGPAQFRQYALLSTGSRYIGLEIETCQRFSEKDVQLVSEHKYMKWSYVRPLECYAEVQVLLPADNPIVMFKTLEASWKTLASINFSLMGSLHINLEATTLKKGYKTRRPRKVHENPITKEQVIVFENKYCTSSPDCRVVMAQIVAMLLFVKGRRAGIECIRVRSPLTIPIPDIVSYYWAFLMYKSDSPL